MRTRTIVILALTGLGVLGGALYVRRRRAELLAAMQNAPQGSTALAEVQQKQGSIMGALGDIWSGVTGQLPAAGASAAAGSATGAYLGGGVGTGVGGLIGVFFEGVGVVPGAAIGGAVGTAGGAVGGAALGGAAALLGGGIMGAQGSDDLALMLPM